MTIFPTKIKPSRAKEIPTPEVLEAWLPSDGHPDNRATKHKFVETVEATAMFGDTGTVAHTIHAFMYECTETGARRRWGFQ